MKAGTSSNGLRLGTYRVIDSEGLTRLDTMDYDEAMMLAYMHPEYTMMVLTRDGWQAIMKLGY